MERLILGKTTSEWMNEFPLLSSIVDTKEVFWVNQKVKRFPDAIEGKNLSWEDVEEAEALFQRFAPFIEKAFPVTADTNGEIESPLKEIANMKDALQSEYDENIPGQLWLKCDNELAVAGSIKARGGFFEILSYAEKLALEHGLITKNDDYGKLYNDTFKQFFSNYSIAVGSTGNLGLSIGIMSAKLGFQVTVHMSRDAKQWKKDLLRDKGAKVMEYESDFSLAVEKGREMCEENPQCYFVDDEDSKHLFLGYAVAAIRLKKQLDEKGIVVNADHPLIVYIPCGVGGGPSGVTYGLKHIFGDNVYCYFAEPTHSPAVLIGLMTGKFHQVSVQDFGIDNRTAADGLAVGRPSQYAVQMVEHLVNGIYTVEDHQLYRMLYLLNQTEQMKLEPSALAGMYGPVQLAKNHQGSPNLEHATHVVWATGGSLVPEENMKAYINKGKDN
ncbi:D-serine ammonia-lyase [Pontibacillus yanchengensis]|uniref:Probable D-serine dehydratase n=1 Tax=Pontibacillus yanchengensis Y32 TaxID=1385514 RepID=A0A0A2TDF7_9BACI|nr:D-serine ammonia-lyase [Pontibacillus yanchengensis]KGP73599.1 serine ammonia-lyase [Pontibacillus yanchengensis Y32]